MKIGIEAQRIFRKRKHGMDMVAVELIRNLQRIDKTNQYTVFVRPDEDKTVITETSNFKIVELNGGSYVSWEQVVLPRAAKLHGCEVLHCTSNTGPLFTSIPLVITLHDIIFMENSIQRLIKGGGSRYQKFGNVYRRIIVPHLVKKCRKIVTVSDYERNCIGEFFKMVDDQRLVRVYNGVSDYFKPITDLSQLMRVKDKYQLPAQFVFFLGNTHPKKNTQGTLKAFSDFLRKTGSDAKLVMIDYDKEELARLLTSIGDPELMDRIVLTGYVSNYDLPAIYSQSMFFLYPSLRESFGIPIIEAMASGAPVITSSTSSMPEVAGNAALLVDPNKTEDITSAMIAIYKDKYLRSCMISQGIERAAKFSWASMAERMLEIYSTVGIENNANLKYSTEK